MLGIGAVSFGLAVQNSIIVADAANAGGLFGANSTYDITYTSGMQQVATAAGAQVPNFTSTATYFCACTAGGAAVSCTSACGSDQPLYYVEVVTGGSFANFFSYGRPAEHVHLEGLGYYACPIDSIALLQNPNLGGSPNTDLTQFRKRNRGGIHH